MALRRALSHEETEALLGAFVLDACEAEENAAVEAHLAECDECAAEVDEFRKVVELLGAVEAEPPPPHIGAAVLAAATRPVDPAVAAYREATAALAGATEDLSDEEWLRVAAPMEWTCRDLVAHLCAIDSLLVTTLGLDAITPESETEFLPRTLAGIGRNRGGPPKKTVDEWQAVGAALSAYTGEPTPLDDPMMWLGLPLSARGALITRAFETWLHTEDIRDVTGQPRRPPSPDTLSLMSDLAVHLLPTMLGAMHVDVGPAIARVVLTGPGGGTWDLVLGDADFAPGAEPDVVLTADTVEFCRMAGGRRSPDDLGAQIVGDRGLGDALVAAGAAIAMP